jgi:capsular polysaccharide biosynthesis protein
MSGEAYQRPDQRATESTAQLYLALANQFRSRRPTKAGFNIFRGPEIFPSSPGLQELHNAVVLSGEWFVVAEGKAYCDAFVQTPSPPLSAYIVAGGSTITLLCEPPVKLPTRDFFLLGGCANYTHWLLDFLPRIALYRPSYGPLLVNGPLLPFQTQALTYLGVGAASLLALDYPRAYIAPKLFYPSTGSAICMPPMTFQPSILDWLRDKFVTPRAGSQGGRKLFISRAGHSQVHGRRLLNEAEIARIADEHGFEIIRAEELSFEAQVMLFSEASVIAGPHGAGFVNMIFAQRGAKIVEMMGPRLNRERQPSSLVYVNIAAILGQNFVRIVGRSDEPVFRNHTPYETYTIDPNEFRHAIRH